MTEMEQRLAALEQKCDRILEQLSALLAEIQALYPEVKSPDKHVKEADDTVLDYLDVCRYSTSASDSSDGFSSQATCRIQERSPQILSVIWRFQLI